MKKREKRVYYISRRIIATILVILITTVLFELPVQAYYNTTYSDGVFTCDYRDQHFGIAPFMEDEKEKHGFEYTDIKKLFFDENSRIWHDSDYEWIRDNLENLEVIKVDSSVGIPYGAFHFNQFIGGHKNLREFHGKYIGSVGDYAFNMCPKLEKITMMQAKSIGIGTFANSKALKTVDFNFLESIGNLAFLNCESLESISLDKVVSIGEGAFQNCTSLKYISLGNNPPTVGANAFLGCPEDRKLFVFQGNQEQYRTAIDDDPNDGKWYGWTVVPSIIEKSPADDSTSVGINDDLVLRFNDKMYAKYGYIRLRRVSDDTIVDSFKAYPEIGKRIKGSGTDTITIDFPMQLEENTEYYVEIENKTLDSRSCFFSGSHFNFEGIQGKTAWNFKTEDIPNTPIITGTNVTNDTTPTWTWSSGGSGGTGVYRYKLDDSNLDIDASYNVSVSFPKKLLSTEYTPSMPLTEGDHTLYVQETDFDINDCPPSISVGKCSPTGSFTITIDTTPPIVSKLSPVDDTTGVSKDDNLVIDFNENVTKGIGNIIIKQTSNDSIVETIDVTKSKVSVVESTITIDPDVTFTEETDYYVQIDKTAFKDMAGNSYVGIGINDKTRWNFKTKALVSSEKEMISFTLADQTGAADIDNANNTVKIEVANGTNITSLTPTITVSDKATISPASGATQDFSNAVTYTVTGEDGTTKTWEVTVVEAGALSSEKEIISFTLADQTGAADIDNANHTVEIEVANGTSLTNLTPTITVSDKATISPASGAAQDFSNAVTYTVTAEDRTIAIYTITVNNKPSNGGSSSGGSSRRTKKLTYDKVKDEADNVLRKIDKQSAEDAADSVEDLIDSINDLLKDKKTTLKEAKKLVDRAVDAVNELLSKEDLTSEQAKNSINDSIALAEKLKKNGMEEIIEAIKPQITIEASKKENEKEGAKVELPVEILNKLAENKIGLVVKAKGVKFTLPPELMRISKKNLNLQITVKDVKESQRTEAMAQKEDGLKPVGNMYDLDISLADEGTATTKLDMFHSKAIIEIPLSDIDKEKVNIEKLGIYVFSEETNQWEYVKSKVVGDKLVFEAPHFSIYAVMECTKTFKDIQGHWAKQEIEAMAAKHIAKGKDKDNFAPNDIISRAEFTALIVRVLGLEGSGASRFSDVKEDKWYYREISLAADAGIAKKLNGSENNEYAPDKAITREQMITMIARAHKILTGETTGHKYIEFTDKNAISYWNIEEIRYALDKGLVNGFEDNTLRPKDNATRAEAVVMIMRLIKQ